MEDNCIKWIEVINKIFILFGIAILIEVTLFNYRHWESLSFKPLETTDIQLGEGIEQDEEGGYKITNPAEANITVSGFQKHIDNIYIDMKSDENQCIYIELYADDAANHMGMRLGDTTIVSTVPASCFTRLHLSGDSGYVQIKVSHPEGFTFYMAPPKLNVIRPFDISVCRIIVIFICILFFFTFRPGSKIYQVDLRINSSFKKIVLTTFILIHIIVVLVISQLILPNKSLSASLEIWPANDQYNELADAFMKGQVYLDRCPPQSLETIENPYDPGLRQQIVVQEAGESFVWDYAYFKGKYYCYFGPVPVIMFFIPARILFGIRCPTWDIVTLCTVLFCLAGFWMVYVLGKKYFRTLSFGSYLLMSSFYIWGSAIVYLVFYGAVYSLPIICGLFLGTTGLTCWISAKDEGRLKKRFLIIGSICIALLMGCRLQLAVVLFWAFPVFWKEIISRKFFSKKGIGNTLCIITPFVFIGILLMYYNYLRFQSPFDFGANYNLTGNDMTHRGMELDRFPIAVFTYFFQPLSITTKYPFMQVVNVSNDYMGYTSVEPLFGGFFMMNFISTISLLVFHFKKLLRKNHVYGIAVLSFVFAMIIMMADAQMSGLTQRYMSDFGWLISLCTILQFFSLEEIMGKHINTFRKVTLVLVFICLFLNFWNVLIVGRYADLINENPTVFYGIKYSLPFI